MVVDQHQGMRLAVVTVVRGAALAAAAALAQIVWVTQALVALAVMVWLS